ncbi:hypothetical protein LR48_Vigan10g174600 [Vigna angularis]|uniref:Uncharacterized protein n=1 Tax=Phaseolus angularis TaxID=3914 RepID=A0A0L9VM81_PHAAN|nr:hypothetical protein LR48_Vigan10g174600 [Vigna angularis]
MVSSPPLRHHHLVSSTCACYSRVPPLVFAVIGHSSSLLAVVHAVFVHPLSWCCCSSSRGIAMIKFMYVNYELAY